MPHPADHPAAALAITRGLPGQLQKAKAAPPLPAPPPDGGWAEIVTDTRQRRRW
jgi:hypothetical protein